MKQNGPEELVMRARTIEQLRQVMPGAKFKRTLKLIVKSVPYELSLDEQVAKIHEIIRQDLSVN